MTRFQISTRNSGRLRTVQVCIYDTREALERAGNRYQDKNGYEERVGGAMHGLAQTHWREMQVGKRWVKMPDAGYIRLWKGALRTGIITHECSHVAIAIYEQDVAKTFKHHENNETFCYILGDLAAKLVNGLYRHKLIPEHGK